MPEETPPPSLKILEMTYSNFVIARALYGLQAAGQVSPWLQAESLSQRTALGLSDLPRLVPVHVGRPERG